MESLIFPYTTNYMEPLVFPYTTNYKEENILKELETCGQLLDKSLYDKNGLKYIYYKSMHNKENPDLNPGINRSTIDNNFIKIQDGLSELYALIDYRTYTQANPIFTPVPTWKNRISYAFILRFYMFFSNSLYPPEDSPVSFSAKEPICKEFYPIFISLLQFYGSKSQHWDLLKECMLELIEKMLPYIDSAPKLNSYSYWLNLFLPDDLIENINELEKIFKKKEDLITRKNIRSYEDELILLKFHSLTIQKEYYSQIMPILIDYVNKDQPSLSNRAFDIPKYYAYNTEKRWQEKVMYQLGLLYRIDDLNFYKKFLDSKINLKKAKKPKNF